MAARDQNNFHKFGILFLIWLVFFSVATVALRGKLIEPRILQFAVTLAPSILLAGAIIAYIRFIRFADELIRKIHVEALGWGFGAGILFTMGYRLLQRIGAPDLDMNDPVIVMGLCWSLGLWWGCRRYTS